MYNIKLKNSVNYLLVIFGLYGILCSFETRNQMTDSYSVSDLIQGWGIYSVTLGLILIFPENYKFILFMCFISSILWHITISNNTQYTNHHIEAIVMNSIAIIILYFI